MKRANKERASGDGMKLSEEDADIFMKLHASLLCYATNKLEMRGRGSLKDFLDSPIEAKGKVRDALCNRRELIDSFLQENAPKLTDEERAIVLGWKDFVKGSFCIVRSLKEHTVIVDSEEPPHAYGILGISGAPEDILGQARMFEGVLLPFKGRIVWDGIVRGYSILFGAGARRGFEDSFREAEFAYGVITSLPFSGKPDAKGDEEKLKFYLKNASNREKYDSQIRKLMRKSDELFVIYNQEMGKYYARGYGRQLQKKGVSDAWFAVLGDVLIASGKSEEKLRRALGEILPEDKRRLAYVFHLR